MKGLVKKVNYQLQFFAKIKITTCDINLKILLKNNCYVIVIFNFQKMFVKLLQYSQEYPTFCNTHKKTCVEVGMQLC